MVKSNLNSHKGFVYGIFGLGGILVLLLSNKSLKIFQSELATIIMGALFLTIGLTGVIGLSKSLRGLKEPNTLKKVLGIFMNAAIVILYTLLILLNIRSAYSLFSS